MAYFKGFNSVFLLSFFCLFFLMGYDFILPLFNCQSLIFFFFFIILDVIGGIHTQVIIIVVAVSNSIGIFFLLLILWGVRLSCSKSLEYIIKRFSFLFQFFYVFCTYIHVHKQKLFKFMPQHIYKLFNTFRYCCYCCFCYVWLLFYLSKEREKRCLASHKYVYLSRYSYYSYEIFKNK